MKERKTPCSTICQILVYLFSVSYYYMSHSCFNIVYLKTAEYLKNNSYSAGKCNFIGKQGMKFGICTEKCMKIHLPNTEILRLLLLLMLFVSLFCVNTLCIAQSVSTVTQIALGLSFKFVNVKCSTMLHSYFI